MNNSIVKVFKWEATKEPGRHHFEKVPDGDALFHQWGVNYEEFENGASSYTTAIIQREDGSIETPEASLIQFTSDKTFKQCVADAIRRPMGVVPKSCDWITQEELDAAEVRRPKSISQ